MFDKFKKNTAKKILGTDQPIEKKAFVPFDLRLGSKFVLKNNSYFIHKTLFKNVKDGYTVNAIGKFTLQGYTKVFRFYLNNTTDAMPCQHFLQVVVDTETEDLLEVRMFALRKVHNPTTEAAWNKWVGVAGCQIGDIEATCAERTFGRMESWADPDEDWVQPVQVDESIETEDKFIRITHIAHECMLYGRWANEELEVAEYLLLSSVETRYKDGSQTDAVVKYVGIDVAAPELEILY